MASVGWIRGAAASADQSLINFDTPAEIHRTAVRVGVVSCVWFVDDVFSTAADPADGNVGG